MSVAGGGGVVCMNNPNKSKIYGGEGGREGGERDVECH